MKYLLIFFSVFSFGQTTYLFDNFAGATANAKWTTMLSTIGSGDIVEFNSGQTYSFTAFVNLQNVNGLTLRSTGATRATLTSTQTNIISQNDGVNHSCSNITMQGLRFVSTSTEGGNGNGNSLVNIGYGSGINFRFENCEFTAPTASTNGLKFYSSTGSYSNIDVVDCWFHDLGRMGFETVNHQTPAAEDKLFDITVTGTRVENTGLIIYGMGFSFSGRNPDVLVENCEFHNNPTCGVEIIGGIRNTVRNSVFSGTGDTVHTVFGSGVINEDILIENNVSTAEGSYALIGVTGLISRNNTHTGDRRLFFQNLRDVLFENDDWDLFAQNDNLNVTPWIQMFTSQTVANGTVTFQNCNLKVRNSVSFAEIQQGAINVQCSTWDHPTNATSLNNNGTRTDVELRINGAFHSEVGDTGVDCGVIGYVEPTPPPPTSPNAARRRAFYNNFFDN